MKIFYSPTYINTSETFDTFRKPGWIAADLAARPLPGVDVVAPEPAEVRDIQRVHSGTYINALRTGQLPLAESSGMRWCPNLFDAVRASTGGVIAALTESLETGMNSGSLSSGLHHARRDRGSGFCTINGLAVAATGVDANVLIVDLDAHGGGGTYSLVREYDNIVQLDLITAPFDLYDPRGKSTRDIIRRARAYFPTLFGRLAEITKSGWRPDVVLYNAGVDCEERCGLGGMPGLSADDLAERDGIVCEWAALMRVPVAFVLAGGYTGEKLSEQDVVALHRQTIFAAASTTRRPRRGKLDIHV